MNLLIRECIKFRGYNFRGRFQRVRFVATAYWYFIFLLNCNEVMANDVRTWCISKALVVKMRMSTIEIIRTGLWECIAMCVHMVKWASLSGWLTVQTVSYSKLLMGLNFVDLSQYVLNFVDIIYTMKTTNIYTPRNLIRLRYKVLINYSYRTYTWNKNTFKKKKFGIDINPQIKWVDYGLWVHLMNLSKQFYFVS